MIDILVVYTSAAKEAAGGEAAIESQIELMVAETNTAFRDSGAHLRLRLVHVQELDYVETPDSYDLGWVHSSGEVQALRRTAGADLVHLIEKWGVSGRFPYCGLAYLGGSFGVYRAGVRQPRLRPRNRPQLRIAARPIRDMS